MAIEIRIDILLACLFVSLLVQWVVYWKLQHQVNNLKEQVERSRI